MSKQSVESLFSLIQSGTSPFHVVEHCVQLLEAKGFHALSLRDHWSLKPQGSYYCRTFSGELFAFTIPKEDQLKNGIRIGAAHTDFPGFRLKPKAVSVTSQYIQLNTEVYGGPILNTWMDRPLSLAGKVSLKSDNLMQPKTEYIDLKNPVLTIPNVAIHLNPKVNDGTALDRQNHMQPILGLISSTLEKDFQFSDYLAGQLGVTPEAILDYELYVYNTDQPAFTDLTQSLISSPRLDDLTAVDSLVNGLTDAPPASQVNLAALFDNEETGSLSKQGADSIMLNLIIEKIWAAFGHDRLTCMADVADSYILSIDVAHGFHPNYSSQYDPVNSSCLGEGLVIKTSSSQNYAWDSEAIGCIIGLCQAYDIPFQRFANRSNIRGGHTISAIISSQLPLRTIDIGIPLLAMHSARELMALSDHLAMNQLVRHFFDESSCRHVFLR